MLCQGLYLHRIPRELVHDDREFRLIKGSRDILDEETEGVLILLCGHFGEGEGCGRELATTEEGEEGGPSRSVRGTYFSNEQSGPSLSLQPPRSPHPRHSRSGMGTPYWSLIVTVFEVSSSPTPIWPLPRRADVLQSILEVFILCVAGYILARNGILDKKTQRVRRLTIFITLYHARF